jgi:cellulose biosynthesis protein BcsQ
MKFFSVTNMKGGTGKSTLTVLLACAIASDLKKKVAILDTDIQATIHELSKLDNDNLVSVLHCDISDVKNELIKLKSNNYDFVFIDFARFTDSDLLTIETLAMCDAVLVATLGGIIEVLSVQRFVKLLKAIKVKYYIVLNKHKRIKDDFETIEALSKESKVFNATISDLKLFRDVYLNKSILDSSEGKKRFLGFYKEFKNLVINE